MGFVVMIGGFWASYGYVVIVKLDGFLGFAFGVCEGIDTLMAHAKAKEIRMVINIPLWQFLFFTTCVGGDGGEMTSSSYSP